MATPELKAGTMQDTAKILRACRALGSHLEQQLHRGQPGIKVMKSRHWKIRDVMCAVTFWEAGQIKSGTGTFLTLLK